MSSPSTEPKCRECGITEEERDKNMIDLFCWYGEPICETCVGIDQDGLHSRGIPYIANPPKWHEVQHGSTP